MILSDFLHTIIHDLASASGTIVFSWEVLHSFVRAQAEGREREDERFKAFRGVNSEGVLQTLLAELEAASVVELAHDETAQRQRKPAIAQITYCVYFSRELARLYREMEQGRRAHFPQHQTLLIVPPVSAMRTVRISDGVSGILDDTEVPAHALLRIDFSDPLPSVLITTQILREGLPNLAFALLRREILQDWSVSRLHRLLLSVFPDQQSTIRETLRIAVSDTTEGTTFLREATEFQLELLLHICNAVAQEKCGSHRTDEQDQTVCQAVRLLGASIAWHKNQNRKHRMLQEIERLLSRHLRKPPHYFSLSSIESLNDAEGRALKDLIAPEKLRLLLDGMSQVIVVETLNREIWCVATTEYETLLERMLKETRPVVRASTLEEMIDLLRRKKRRPWMTDDAALEGYLESSLDRIAPLLVALVQHDTPAHLHGQQWRTILEIDREAVYRSALQEVPFWRRIRG